METRGKRNALFLKASGGRGRAISHEIDRASLTCIWINKGRADPPEGLIEDLVVLASKQDISEATERGVLEGEVEDAVAAVEVAARKLQKALRNLKDTTTGPAHYDAWMVPFMGRLPGTEASYPDAFLEEILAALALARPRYYRRQPLKEHWHCFIREVQELFANYGEPTHCKASSIFVQVLCELDRQFPGLSFPPKTVPTGRVEYVRGATSRSGGGKP